MRRTARQFSIISRNPPNRPNQCLCFANCRFKWFLIIIVCKTKQLPFLSNQEKISKEIRFGCVKFIITQLYCLQPVCIRLPFSQNDGRRRTVCVLRSAFSRKMQKSSKLKPSVCVCVTKIAKTPKKRRKPRISSRNQCDR